MDVRVGPGGGGGSIRPREPSANVIYTGRRRLELVVVGFGGVIVVCAQAV
jgi:hypothetical protein